MTDPDLQTELTEFVQLGHIKSWSRINGRWVVDYYDWWNESDVSVPFTKPQVEAFLSGISCGLGWVKKVAAELDAADGRDRVGEGLQRVREKRDGICDGCGESVKDEDGYHYGNGCVWAGKLWDSVPKQTQDHQHQT